MEGIIHFNYHQQQYSASYLVCQRRFPTYIYVTFNNQDLVRKFGEEVVIHTDGQTVLTNHVYSEQRIELFIILLNSIKGLVSLRSNTEQFLNQSL